MVVSNNSINNTVGYLNSGASNTLTVQNLDNTSTLSAARCNIFVGGTSAGPAWEQYTAGSSRAWAVGMNTQSSQGFAITTNASGTVNPTGTAVLTASTIGNILKPLNAAFFAYLNPLASNVTGAGVRYTIVFNNVTLNRQSVFNTSSGTFTAPVTGVYLFTLCVFTNPTSSNSSTITGVLVGATTYYLPGCATAQGNTCFAGGSIILSLSSGNTVQAFVTVNGGTSGSVSVLGTTPPAYETWFSGCLIS